MKYMLDTNIVSHVMRFPQGKITKRLFSLADNTVSISLIVFCELHFGVVKKGSRRLLNELDGVLKWLPVSSIGEEISQPYAITRTFLEASGNPIGSNDLLIAAHALSLDAVLVTDNDKEFSRVPNLRVENWLVG